MLVIGAGGFAVQLFEDIEEYGDPNTVFWSETETRYNFIKEKYKIISTDADVKNHFTSISTSFVLCVGIGHMKVRKQMAEKFRNLGGEMISLISPRATISKYSSIGEGTIILSKVYIEPDVQIGKECVFNVKSNAAHGCSIASYCEIGPAAILTGEVEMGENSSIGTGSIIFPKVKIGKNATVAAGSLVKRNVPDNAVVSGNPAVIKFYKKQ